MKQGREGRLSVYQSAASSPILKGLSHLPLAEGNPQ